MERRFVEEAWNRGNLEVIDESHDPDLVIHWIPGANDVDGLKEYIQSIRRAFPDFHMAIDFVTASDDTVTVGFTANGTHTRRFMGVPATNRLVHINGIWTHRIEDGTIVEGWTSFNGHDVLQQLGLRLPGAMVRMPLLYARRLVQTLRRS